MSSSQSLPTRFCSFALATVVIVSTIRWLVLAALRTGLVEAAQVVYNTFDQRPDDQPFPGCNDLDVAGIFRAAE